MEISTEWILGSILGLAGVIATMAKLIYDSLSAQIKSQNKIIDKLQDDVDRMSKGCGAPACQWTQR
jgi:outer membrane murein-binding lipoprotein Lpp